jgi:Tfp pilus assembly protein PilV
MQTPYGTLSARSLKGFNSRLKGVARELAVAIGILLSMASMPSSQASIDATKSLKILANNQLTDKQYKCHNEIVYRESRWDRLAVNGSHHGYYQMRSKSMQGKPYDYQFYIYWYYVSKRYGLDYEIPDYCKALHHLKTRGWQ